MGRGRPRIVRNDAEAKVLTKTIKQYKDLFIVRFKENQGFVSRTLTEIGLSRKKYDTWLAEDIKFYEQVIEIQEGIKDGMEEKLYEGVKKGSTRLIEFVSRTKLRDRGYQEVSELQISNDNITINIIPPKS